MSNVDTLALDPRTAEALIALRRGSGVTPSALASSTGVPVAVIEGAERGDPVPRGQLGAALSGLGLDPRAVVGGLPHGPVPVRPVDVEHARTMAYLADAARVTDGWLLHPDAAAGPAPDAPDDGLERLTEAHDAWRPWCLTPALALAVIAGVLLASSGVGMVADVVLGASRWWSGVWREHYVDAVVGSGLTALGVGVVSVLIIVWGSTRANPHARALEDARAVRDAAEERRQGVDDLRSRAYAVSRDGVTAYAVTPSGLERREYLASSFRSIGVDDVGPGHVDVTIDTLVGRVVMRWLPRNRDLADLVDGWRARAGAIAGALEGPQ